MIIFEIFKILSFLRKSIEGEKLMEQNYDVIVVGGGTSGMMAAISAAKNDATVLLIEKNKRFGKKLMITGGGRCNVTNNRPIDDLIAHIPGNGRFLYSTFSQFNNEDIMVFFEEAGVHLKEEDHGRMFPVTDKSATIIDALVSKMKELNVTLLTNCNVEKLLHDSQQIQGVRTDQGDFHAPCCILATGGKTYPSTGSTGDGYRFAKKVGHTVTPLYPTESALLSNEPFILEKTLQGISLREIGLTVLNDKGKEVTSHQMDLLFTHFGLSGPAALRCSSFVNQLLKEQETVTVVLDCFPTLSSKVLFSQFEQAAKQSKKALKNAWREFLPERFLLFLLDQLNLAELPAYQIQNDQIEAMIELLKHFPIRIYKTLPIEKSFVTGGGIHLKEIHPKTMESKLLNGLFFCGEVIDVNGYTGGFNITAAFCTGHCAGKHAAEIASYSNNPL